MHGESKKNLRVLEPGQAPLSTKNLAQVGAGQADESGDTDASKEISQSL
jgi:hypothetical protein